MQPSSFLPLSVHPKTLKIRLKSVGTLPPRKRSAFPSRERPRRPRHSSMAMGMVVGSVKCVQIHATLVVKIVVTIFGRMGIEWEYFTHIGPFRRRRRDVNLLPRGSKEWIWPQREQNFPILEPARSSIIFHVSLIRLISQLCMPVNVKFNYSLIILLISSRSGQSLGPSLQKLFPRDDRREAKLH